MSKVGQISEEVKRLYEADEEEDEEVKRRYEADGSATSLKPVGSKDEMAKEFASLSVHYCDAAAAVLNAIPTAFLPYSQLAGQAVELAIKSVIHQLGKWDEGKHKTHNLVKLLEVLEKNGVDIDDGDVAIVCHLSHVFAKDLVSGTSYKTRYPTDREENLGGVLVLPDRLRLVVNRLLENRQGAVSNV